MGTPIPRLYDDVGRGETVVMRERPVQRSKSAAPNPIRFDSRALNDLEAAGALLASNAKPVASLAPYPSPAIAVVGAPKQSDPRGAGLGLGGIAAIVVGATVGLLTIATLTFYFVAS
jgi:hypothetical protein